MKNAHNPNVIQKEEIMHELLGDLSYLLDSYHEKDDGSKLCYEILKITTVALYESHGYQEALKILRVSTEEGIRMHMDKRK